MKKLRRCAGAENSDDCWSWHRTHGTSFHIVVDDHLASSHLFLDREGADDLRFHELEAEALALFRISVMVEPLRRQWRMAREYLQCDILRNAEPVDFLEFLRLVENPFQIGGYVSALGLAWHHTPDPAPTHRFRCLAVWNRGDFNETCDVAHSQTSFGWCLTPLAERYQNSPHLYRAGHVGIISGGVGE